MGFRRLPVSHFLSALSALDLRQVRDCVARRHVPVRSGSRPPEARLESLLVDQRSERDLLEDGFRFRELWQLLAGRGRDDEGAKPGLRDSEVASLEDAESHLNLVK